MRFVVCGAGAIGGVLGGQLAKAGYDVVFIESMPERARALRQNGLQLKGVHGHYTLRIPTVQHAHEVDWRSNDVIFLAVKAFDCEAAVAALRRATVLEVPIFCAQNGVANEAIAARSFQHVNGLMLLVAATCLVPGQVIHTGNGPVGIGTYPNGLSQTATAVAAALDHTDLPVYTTAHIVPAKWHKLLLNLNSATMGLTGLASEDAWAQPAARLWMADVWEEGIRVLHAAGIAYEAPPGLPTVADSIRLLRDVQQTPPAPVDEQYKSRAALWQDLFLRRGAVEAEYVNGEIVRLGRQHGVPTPYNSLLLALSTAMATARELPGTYTIQQLRAHL